MKENTAEITNFLVNIDHRATIYRRTRRYDQTEHIRSSGLTGRITSGLGKKNDLPGSKFDRDVLLKSMTVDSFLSSFV